MNTFLATLRSAYFLAAIVLFGELVFRCCVERVAWHRLPAWPAAAWLALRPRFALLATALAAAWVCGTLWFLAEVQIMSGMPLEAISLRTFLSALFDTEFGRVALVRLGLMLALAIALARLREQRRTAAMTLAAGACALGILASIAWTGHANNGQGLDRLIYMGSDVMHLLAAGAWLGALPALTLILFRARRDGSACALAFAALAAKRFSSLGIAAVSTLVLSGIANSWHTLGSVPALLGTNYGRLLSLKLLLFCAMLALAAMNRLRHTPRLHPCVNSARETSRYKALTRLGVNATAELALGIAIVCIVGALGTGTPAAHGQTVWPFRYTFSLTAAQEHGLSTVACLAAILASMIAAVRLRRRHRPAAASAAAVVMAALSFQLSFIAVPATPSTYFRSPVRYSAQSVAAGGRLYAAQCLICHGPRAHGDGPAAAALAERPANLPEHVLHHRHGDVWWWIKHGIPGTPMPAFAGSVPDDKIWDIINWLRAQAEAEQAEHLQSAVQSLAIQAPDFTFQIDHERQESLADQRGRADVLLVLFDPATSLDRLRALSKSQRELTQAGLRVIAVPACAAGATAANIEGVTAPILANFDRQIAVAYAILAPVNLERDDASHCSHAEFLIDQQGYIRARWAPQEDAAWLQMPYLTRQTSEMDRIQPRPSFGESDDHVH